MYDDAAQKNEHYRVVAAAITPLPYGAVVLSMVARVTLLAWAGFIG